MQTLHRLLKWLGFLALGCYVLVAVAFLGLRYWVVPNIDRWREPMQRELSSLLSEEVRLGRVTADWNWRGPRLTLRDSRLYDDSGRLLLELPSLDVVLAWPDLLSGSTRFLSLRADGVELSVRRDADDKVTLLGFEIEGDDEGDADDAVYDFEILHWLSRQGNLGFTNARIRWIDEARRAPALLFDDVSLAVGTRDGDVVFSMRARPPDTLGRSFAMQARLSLRPGSGASLSIDQVSGLFHVNVEGMRPANWQPWLEVHSALRQGEVSWQGWQEMANGVPGRHVSLVSVSEGSWDAFGAARISAESARLYLAGPWPALEGLWSGHATGEPESGEGGGVRVALQTRGLTVNAPDLFPAPLRFDDFAVSGSAGGGAETGLRLEADRLQLRNTDMDLDVRGGWQRRGGGEAGVVDMHGRFERVELAAIVRYLPNIVDADAREWMSHGLLAGRLSDAPVRVRGDLEHFPFGEQPGKGDFELGGPVRGVVIDYAPAAVVGPPGWPRLERLNGHARLHRVDLQVRADTMQMRPEGLEIELRDVQARIPNIEENAVLDVQGVGHAQAEAVLALVRASPLSRLLDRAFDLASGEGRWEVPLSLTIPLFDTDETRVAGALVFDDARLGLAETLPDFSGLSGRISFTETVLKAEGLKGRVLGEPVAISGGIGQGESGLVFAGRLSDAALGGLLGERFDGLLSGATAYRLAVQRSSKGAYGIRFDSSLEGLAIDVPEPLGKAAAVRRPLEVRWTDHRKGEAVLEIGLDGGLEARFVHREGAKDGTFFHAGELNLRGSAEPGGDGLAVDIAAPRIDLDAWRTLAARFEEGGEAGGTAVLPPLRSLRLQSDAATVLGTDLDHLTFTVRPAEGRRWRVDVSSTQTAGTLFWRERSGGRPGDVEAKFERLTLGTPREEQPGETKMAGDGDDATWRHLEKEIDIPAIRLDVDRLRLYGRNVGALSVVGVNEAQGRLWRLEQLELASPHGAVRGSGVWRLDGERRGFSLRADAEFGDLGAWLEQAGFNELMQGGKGRVQGHVEWRDVPWRFDRSRLDGELDIELSEGRLISLGSRSARLLELLSLQSVKRLATLDWNPAGLMKQGFPFDTLDGHVTLAQGVLHSENYRVVGPVASIAIAGDVDLPEESLDLYAVVVPSLDVSGAALAAGIVNPIVGLGAFVTQWLLKAPLSKAMAVEYRVKGGFDAPKLEEISTRGVDGGGNDAKVK